MSEVTKYQLISPNNNIISDIKTQFSLIKTRKGTTFIYGVILVFVLVTIFLAFSPSANIFSVNSTSTPDESYRSNFSSVYSLFFPDNSTETTPLTQNNVTSQVPISKQLLNNQTVTDKVGNFEQHNSTSVQLSVGSAVDVIHDSIYDIGLKQNNSTSVQLSVGSAADVIHDGIHDIGLKQNNSTSAQLSVGSAADVIHDIGLKPVSNNSTVVPPVAPTNITQSEKHINNTVVYHSDKGSEIPPQIPSISTKGGVVVGVNSSDLGVSLSKNRLAGRGNDSVSGGPKDLVGCDLYDGKWVMDDSYPLYKPGSCKLVDEQFNCFLNGRPDNDYHKLKWKPNGCALPRMNARHMLNLLRGKRLVFVGDSLNRNMWESLVCIFKSSVKKKKKVYEAFGRHHFRTEASYSFVFKDYNCTVEFFVSPFLVQQWEVTDKNGATKETLRLDQMVSDAHQYKDADYIVFNTGHWWTHDKTSKGDDYYQEGNYVYKQLDVKEAFRRAITTWARWVDANINPQTTHVLFRGYSASHFRGGQWNSGGQCDGETEPIKNKKYLTHYPWKMKVFESIIMGMKTPISFLNITRLTDYRKDGHPSVFRKHDKISPFKYQDCSHWCLPGVPDSWNELLYAEILRKQYLDQHMN